MRIEKIRIDGYKNLIDTTIEFNGLTALVALNNYGKSNLFHAIEFGNDFIQAPSKGKMNLMKFKQAIPINKISESLDFTFEIIGKTLFEGVISEIAYLFSFEWAKRGKGGCRIVKESLKIRQEDELKPTTYINRNIKNKLYKSSKTGRCDRLIKIEDDNLIINKLFNYDDLFYIDIISTLNNIEFTFLPLDNIKKYFVPQTVSLVDNNGILEGMQETPNIGKYFYDLSQKEKGKFDLLVRLINDLLPDIEYIKPIQIDFKYQKPTKSDIPFLIPEKIYDIRVKVKTNNQETSVNQLSEGSKRIFHILASALTADFDKVNILGLEELENSIHPVLLKRLLDMITQLTEHTQVVITSHSPHLIKYMELENIYLGVPNEDGVAYFKKIKKSKQKKLINLAENSGSNLGDFIFDILLDCIDKSTLWHEFI